MNNLMTDAVPTVKHEMNVFISDGLADEIGGPFGFNFQTAHF